MIVPTSHEVFGLSDTRSSRKSFGRTDSGAPMTANPYEAPNADATQEHRESRIASIRSIPFRTYFLLCVCIGFSSGIVVGVGALIASPTGAFDFKLTDRLGGFELQGMAAGFLAILVIPPYVGMVLALLSVPAYIPFCLTVKLIRRLRFVVVISDDAE